jgi:hypothetical protein
MSPIGYKFRNTDYIYFPASSNILQLEEKFIISMWVKHEFSLSYTIGIMDLFSILT